MSTIDNDSVSAFTRKSNVAVTLATELGLALIAHIKEQDAKIQRVSDQLEMSQCAALLASVK